MKKLLSVLLSVLLLLSMVPMGGLLSATAADDPTIVVSEASGKAGDTVSVTVRLENNPGLVSAKVAIGYDSNALELVGYTAGDFTTSGYFWGKKDKNPFVIGWCDAIGDDSTAELLAALTFKIKDTAAAGTYPLTLDYSCDDDFYNTVWDTIYFNGEEGFITVEGDEPEVPEGSHSAVIEFTDIANRVSYSTSQQVWKQNGITVTNDKGASTSNVGDYGGDGYPARFYKSSTVTIEYPGMTKLVINCEGLDSKYVNSWADSAVGANATVDGGLVTIVFDKAVDSFTWETLTAQGRAYSITVYCEDGEPVVPPVTDDPVIVVSDVVGKPGDTVSVTIRLENNPGLVSAKVKVSYDTNALELVEYAAGDFPANGYAWGKVDKNPFVIVFCDAIAEENYTEELLATLTFKIKKGAANGTYPLTLNCDWEGDFYNLAWDTVYFDIDEGSVTVESDEPATPTIPYEPVEGNLIVNGSFETGDASGWETWQDTTISADAAHSGYYGAHLKGNGGWGGMLNQTIAVEAGATYKLSFWINVNAVGVNVQVKDASGWSIANAGGWFDANKKDYQVEWTFEATDDAVYINFCGSGIGTPENAYVDDFVLVKVGGSTPDVPVDPTEPTIVLPEIVAKAGDEISVPVLLKSNPGLVSAKVKVGYDANVLELIEYAAGDFPASGYSWGRIDKSPFVIVFCDAIAEENYTEELLATLTFKIKKGAANGTYPLTLNCDWEGDFYNLAWDTVYFDIDEGSVTVESDEPATPTIPYEPVEGNLIVNGSFETGDASGWETWQDTTISADAAHSGYYGAHLKGNGGWGGLLNQTIAVEAGATYKLSFWMNVNANGLNVLVRDGANTRLENAGGWFDAKSVNETVEWTFVATDDTVNLIFCGSGNDKAEDVYVDDIVLVKVKDAVDSTTPTIVVSDVTGKPGDTVSVTISLKDNPGLVSAKVKVGYDTNALGLIAYEAGDFPANGYSWGQIAKNPLAIVFCDAIASENYTCELFATLTFRIKNGAAAGTYPLTLEYNCEDDFYNLDWDVIWFEADEGSVTVEGSTVCSHEYDYECDPDCNLCGAIRDIHNNLVHVLGVAPTATQNGNLEHWYCQDCGCYWLDAALTKITNHLAVILPATGEPEGDPCIVMPDVEAAAGDTVTVPILLKNNPGLVSAKVAIDYDQSALELVEYAAGEFPANSYTWGRQDRTPFVVNFCNAIADADYACELLATLTFKVKDGAAAGTYPLTLVYSCDDDFFNLSWETVYFDVDEGSITVENSTPDVPVEPDPTEPTIVLPNIQAAAGDEITVPILLKNNPGLVSAKVAVGYDSNVLELIDKATGDFPANAYSWSKLDRNPFIVNFVDAIADADYTYELLATLTFKIKDGAAHGTYPLTLEFSCDDDFYNTTWDTIYFDGINGSVTISDVCRHAYDADCDPFCNLCGESRPVHTDGIIHFDAVEPGCHYVGNIEYWFCAECECFWQDEALTQLTNSKNVIIPAIGGDVVAFEAIEPACHYNGRIAYWFCPECEQFWQDEALTQLTNSKNVILPAIGSENVQHVEAVAPTCYSQGNIEFWYCADCGQFWQDENLTQLTNAKNVILGVTNHTIVHIDAVAPGCHYVGNIEYWYCTECEIVWADEALTQITNHKNVIIPATGGNVIHFDEVAPACHYIGNIEYWFCTDCEQYWQDEALTQLTNSKNIILPALGGDVIHYDAVEPTCYSYGNIDHWYCRDCEQYWGDEALTQLTNSQYILIAKIPHTFVPTIGYAPTCVSDGLTDGEQCAVCGEVNIAQQAIPALGHDRVDVTGYGATCTAEGLTDGQYCQRCAETLIAQEVIPALGHDAVNLDGHDATCTEDGLTDGKICARCDEILVEQAVIPAYGHSYTGTVTLKPTCGAEGVRTYTCYVCDDSYTESISATGEHVYDHQYDVDCNNCGDVREVPEIPADAPALVVDDVKAKPGEEFTVAIRIQNNPGIVSFKFKVHYDTALFELIGYEDGAFASGSISYGPIEKDPFVVNFCDAINPDNTANDVVVYLTFRVKDGVEKAESAISLSYDIVDVYNAAWESIFFNTVEGTVKVANTVYGDADGDGRVNNRDLGFLKQYLNDWDVVIDMDAADVDGDGRVTNRDMGTLQKYLNDWDIELG